MEATPEMLEAAGAIAGWSGSIHMADVEHSDWYEDIVSASPGADLLERIVKALKESEDRISFYAKAVSYEERGYAFRIRSILDELGGGHG
jgi:hypothetical protein